MNYDKLIEQYRQAADKWEKQHPVTDTFDLRVQDALRDAATAIETLRVENAEMEKQLNEFSEFLYHMTGGLLSKTNYTAQAMISAAEDYQQRVCDNDCGLQADLARVTAERDAAIKDIWVAKWTSCKYGEGCDFISARTGCLDCAECGDWEWRGLKED